VEPYFSAKPKVAPLMQLSEPSAACCAANEMVSRLRLSGTVAVNVTVAPPVTPVLSDDVMSAPALTEEPE
jgi:hypothetical protein